MGEEEWRVLKNEQGEARVEGRGQNSGILNVLFECPHKLDPKKEHIKTSKMDVYDTASELYNEQLEIYFDECYSSIFSGGYLNILVIFYNWCH